jgi:hypothetical protein
LLSLTIREQDGSFVASSALGALLGKPIAVAWIHQEAKKSSIRFLYSKTRGVSGFISLNPKGPLFLLENGCGFGASKDCKDRTSKR